MSETLRILRLFKIEVLPLSAAYSTIATPVVVNQVPYVSFEDFHAAGNLRKSC